VDAYLSALPKRFQFKIKVDYVKWVFDMKKLAFSSSVGFRLNAKAKKLRTQI
tara:strand:+ start:272 stop:427 length:156 start_codon:yes stop_codon:yes gene_type:complete